MANNILGHFGFNYKTIIIDEIALEGLEGIGLSMLWKRVGKHVRSPITDKMKIRLWDYVVKYDNIELYILPEPAPDIEIIDRFDYIDDSSGYLQDPDDYFDGPYQYCPVENEYGSCQHYHKRVLIPKDDIRAIPYSDVENQYGNTLVMVASMEDRWQALVQHKPMTYLSQMTPPQYCILELIGRGRSNGQTTTGKSNLLQIIKDPKLLFYNRKYLQESDLVRAQIITQNMCNKGNKSILLRLRRFHESKLKTIPKRGSIKNIIDHLLTKPDYCDRTDEMYKIGLLTTKNMKKLQKNINIFDFEERTMPMEMSSKPPVKNIKRKYIILSNRIDECSYSENEDEEPPLKCQYKIGVGLLRQAYDQFLEAGLKGLTYMEIGQLLAIRFYTCRAICRVLKQNNLVREFLEDQGRQRQTRYIAVAATRKLDITYAEEKKKLLDFLDISVNARKRNKESTSHDDQDCKNTEVPAKKIKLESEDNSSQKQVKGNDNSSEGEISIDTDNIDITELKVLEGLENSNVKSLLTSRDSLTLRQLKFANGILKILNERLCISGYMTLGAVVAKEINESPMATKSLKAFIQKLVSDGYIKVYNLRWPGTQQRFSKLICAAHVKRSDPVIKSKYKEVLLKSILTKNIVKKEPKAVTQTLVTQATLPRYAKVRKLHECLTTFAYFQPIKNITHNFPEGFILVSDLIPELTVEFAVSYITKTSMTDEIRLKVTEDILPLKLREAPADLYQLLLQSNSLKSRLKDNLKILAMLGLLQLVYNPDITNANYSNSSLFSFLVYVNRRAKILDTRGDWPKKGVDMKSIEKSFFFQSFDNVTNFWEEVFNISIHTCITMKNRQGNKKLMPPVHLENEVHDLDNGERYGDGMGPCGFDSYFFMDVPWFWRAFYPKTVKYIRRKRKITQKSVPKIKAKLKRAKKVVKKRALSPCVPVVKRPSLKRLPTTRKSDSITWSKEEDKIIVLCKAAISIMSPTSQLGCLRVRNYVAKDLLSIKEPKKTIQLCHRRALSLDNDSTMVHEMECIINEMRRRRTPMQKYEGVLKKIRLRHSTSMLRYIKAARLNMLELVWFISQVIQTKSYTEITACMAHSYEEFNEKYTLTPSTANKYYNVYKVNDNSTLKEAIIMTVMLSLDSAVSDDISRKIYSIFKVYPESSLRTAIEHLRKCGAVAAKEKTTNATLGLHHLENIVQSSYKISASYRRKWSCRLNNDFVNTLGVTLETELSQNDIKGSPEINCFMCEMQASGILNIISATVPVIIGDYGTNILQEENLNVIDIESKFRLKSGTLGWKNNCNMKNLSEVYANLKVESVEALQCINKTYFVEINNEKPKNEDTIISYLFSKKEAGAAFLELKEVCGYETRLLKEKLSNYESKNIIKRVGYYENIIILSEFIEPWSVKTTGKNVIPAPWLSLDGYIKFQVFHKWAGAVMNKIFESPACSVAQISDACELLTCRSAQDLCIFLEKTKCIKLKNLVKQEIDLFSDNEIEPQFEDFNVYATFDSMLAFPVKDALTRYSYIRKMLLDELPPFSNTDDKNNYAKTRVDTKIKDL